MSVKFSVDVYPEYDAYVRIRPSVLIDLSTARRKEETGGRGRERAPLDLFSRTLSRRISAFYIRVVAIGREKFTFLFRSIRGICVIEAQKRSIFINYREIIRRGEGRDREEDEARITSIFTFSLYDILHRFYRWQNRTSSYYAGSTRVIAYFHRTREWRLPD